VLYVDDFRRGHIGAFDIAPNGMLARQTDRVFADLRGPEHGILQILAFGGPDWKTLFLPTGISSAP
jgi:hypothetical protein